MPVRDIRRAVVGSVVAAALAIVVVPARVEAAPDVDGAVDALWSIGFDSFGNAFGAAGLMFASVGGLAGDIVAIVDNNEYTSILLGGVISTPIKRISSSVSQLSTGAMEEVLSNHPDVAECAVIGVADEIKGQVPLGFLVLKAGVARAAGDITGEAVAMVRRDIGPVAAFKTATVVERLPKTRSGKILRGTMSAIADGEAWKMPATIDDPAILDEIADALREIGYAEN